jgi:hypothetical protein
MPFISAPARCAYGTRTSAKGHHGSFLITEGGTGESRAAVAAVRALAAAGYRAAVTISDTLSLAGASRSCAARVPVPPVVTDPHGYAAAVRAELASGPYLAVLPASDPALLALDFPVRHLLDKIACAEAARRVGLKVPPTHIFASIAELLDAASQLEYPVVVKPAIKKYLAVRVESPEKLIATFAPRIDQEGRMIVQPYLGAALRGVVGLAWKGHLLQTMHMRYHRLWPVPCGTVASASTIAPDPELEERLARLLEGYDGVFHADLAGHYLLDVNPRIHATLPLALASGTNPVARYGDLLRGQRVNPAHSRAGIFFRWLEGDVRSVLRGVRDGQLGAWSAVRALMPRRGTVHSYESWRDPGPLWTRARYIARRLRHPRAAGQLPLRQQAVGRA